MRASTAPAYIPNNQFGPVPLFPGQKPSPAFNARQTAFEMRTRNLTTDSANKDAASALKSMLRTGEEEKGGGNDSRGQKRKWDEGKSRNGNADDEDDEPKDDVKLYEAGWKERSCQLETFPLFFLWLLGKQVGGGGI